MPEASARAPEQRRAGVPAAVTSLRGPGRAAAILSVASELPTGRLTNAELAAQLDITEDWILTRTGIRERPRAQPDERLTDYATRAGASALAKAGIDGSKLDLVIVATMSQDELTPNTAPLVAHALGAQSAGGVDVGAACTAFMSGLALGAAQIESGRADRVLLIGADLITRIVDYSDKGTAALFADGAGAILLGEAQGDYGAIGPIVMGTDGSHGTTIIADHSDRKLRMDGREVFRHAVARMSEVTLEAIARCGLALDDIDLFVYHQANARITRAIGERLELASERVVNCIETLGNTSAASIPLALAAAQRDGRLQPGGRVLMSAFGAGFTWAGGVIEWGLGDDG
ncbi:MAG: beta-ketoacyl-ACP synthase III [Solirubrobacteraceae bacterium]